MKFDSPPRSTSFYESFSDLIFTTLAIFVMLMLIFATQMRPEIISREKLEELQEQLRQTKQALDDAVAVQTMELVVVVDASGSMERVLGDLRQALFGVARKLSPVAKELRVGVVAYRAQPVVFPLTTIRRVEDDGGASLNALSAWMEQNLRHEGSPVDVKAAVASGVAMLRPAAGTGAQQALVLLGDVGPYESGDQVSRDARAIGDEAEILRLVGELTADSTTTSVVTVFTRDPGSVGQPLTEIDQYTIAFFEAMAALAGARGSYTDDADDVLTTLLLATLGVALE